MKTIILVLLLVCSGLATAGNRKVFSNEPGAWETDAASWKPFLIERTQDSVSRVTGGKGTKTSQFVLIKSEPEWYQMLSNAPYMANGKLMGIFGHEDISVFCTKSCDTIESDRIYYGLEGMECTKNCNSKLSIEKYFSDNQMNFRPNPKRVGPKVDAATGIPIGPDGMYHDPLTGQTRTPAEEASRKKASGKRKITI